MGGFFVGQIVEGRAEIEAAIPALKATSSLVDLTFDHEVWMEVVNKVDSDYPGKVIVGWFHSHPGHGVFLSGYDKFIHQSFFVADGMVALVVDPVDGAVGWFPTEGGEIGSALRSKIDPAPAAVAAAKAKAKAAKRAGQSASISTIVVTGLVAAIIAGAGGFIFGSKQAKSDALSVARQDLKVAQQARDDAEAQLSDKQIQLVQYQTAFGTFVQVREGDTLEGIARQYTGNPENAGLIKAYVLTSNGGKTVHSNKKLLADVSLDKVVPANVVGRFVLVPRFDALDSPSSTTSSTTTSTTSSPPTTAQTPNKGN
jgi:proteasome lid subunit RPN8/RPN11